MGRYSIKDFEQLSGVKAHTIRIWEQRYGLLSPQRTGTNIRFYDDEQLRRLLNVVLLTRNGHKVSAISRWKDDHLNSEIERLHKGTQAIETDVNATDLLKAMIDMDASLFHTVFTHSTRAQGFEYTVRHLFYPLLEKIGVLWSIGQIIPAQEHFISCLIRQKMIAAIDGLPEPQGGKRFLLVLPPGEHHELGLLLASYLIKRKGHRTYYLGQDVPERDIASAVALVKPDATVSFLVDPTLSNRANQVAQRLSEACGSVPLLLATRAEATEAWPKGCHLLRQVDDLDQHL